MTTYGFKLSLDEQELWAIKEAMEFYLTAEATDLRKNNPHLVKYAAVIKLKELLSSGKLYKELETRSSNNFGQLSRQSTQSVLGENNAEVSLATIVIQKLQSNPLLLALAETPIVDMFIEQPKLRQLILDCIVDSLESTTTKKKDECKKLLEDDVAREIFCRQVSLQLYIDLNK